MARRKNVKRIDPRYFLHETVNRNDDGSRMEESNQCVSCLAEAGRCTCDHTGCHSNPAGKHDCDGGWRLEEEAEFQDTGLQEDKAEHIQGVSDKIDRLRQAVKAAERGMENAEEAAQGDLDILMDIRTNNSYWAKQQEVSNLNDKISLLLKQLRQLQQDSPGQLKRGT